MGTSSKKRGLGRGLDSLFSDNSPASGDKITELRLSEIEPNRDQPRKVFDEAALAELADSIKKHGLLQPITVRPIIGGGYQIIAGERRWRACRLAELSVVPAIIRDVGDDETMELALIENLQREDLSPLEEAEGYRSLMEQCQMTQEEVASRMGKSRSAIANSLRLLTLDDASIELLRNNDISAGHARALLAISDPEERKKASQLAKSGASVREIERISKAKPNKKEPKPAADSFFKEVELALTSELGRKIRITGSNGKGSLEIDFYSREDLADIANRLAGEK